MRCTIKGGFASCLAKYTQQKSHESFAMCPLQVGSNYAVALQVLWRYSCMVDVRAQITNFEGDFKDILKGQLRAPRPLHATE